MHTASINPIVLENYINKCVADAAEAENRPNDVRYEYLILDKYLLFACESKYQGVTRRLFFRLLNNLPKNFGLRFNLLKPDPIHMKDVYRADCPFDMYETDIDPNYSILPCTMLGYTGTISAKLGNCIETGTPHMEKLKEHGYDYMTRDHDEWEVFYNAYIQAYHMTPFEGWLKTRKHYQGN